MSISLPCVEQVDHHSFVLTLPILPGDVCRKGLEDKTYPAMDSPVHGESDDASCILVEDCNRKLCSLYSLLSLYKLILVLLLPLCSTVTSKVLGFYS